MIGSMEMLIVAHSNLPHFLFVFVILTVIRDKMQNDNVTPFYSF